MGSKVRVRRPINLCTGDVPMHSVGVLSQSRSADRDPAHSLLLSSLSSCKSSPHFQLDHLTGGSEDWKSDAQIATPSPDAPCSVLGRS